MSDSITPAYASSQQFSGFDGADRLLQTNSNGIHRGLSRLNDVDGVDAGQGGQRGITHANDTVNMGIRDAFTIAQA
jgi:hypothetical protein